MKTAICIASGPSLTPADVDYCRGKGRVYVVKECRLLAPWADVLYAADADWWDKNEGCADFAGERWTVDEDAAKKYGLNFIPFKNSVAWSNDPAYIASGGHSGFQALNLAVHQGAERVILLGYDMGHTPGADKHWWDKEHPRESRYSNYAHWLERMNKAAPLIPVPVLNATICTAITCFPKVELRGVL